MTRPRKPSLHPCVFKERFVREQVDPRVKEIWALYPGGAAPFGRLRLAFQRDHCTKINPYAGSECPYRTEECALAFLSGVQNATLPWIKDPAAYFVKLVASTGITRADEKPLTRERHREERPGDTTAAPARPVARRTRDAEGWVERETDLRRSDRRPDAVGSLLGALNLGARQGRASDGSEGTKR